MAGGPGFEPGLTESESAVLPLNYPSPAPPRKSFNSGFCNWQGGALCSWRVRGCQRLPRTQPVAGRDPSCGSPGTSRGMRGRELKPPAKSTSWKAMMPPGRTRRAAVRRKSTGSRPITQSNVSGSENEQMEAEAKPYLARTRARVYKRKLYPPQ